MSATTMQAYDWLKYWRLTKIGTCDWNGFFCEETQMNSDDLRCDLNGTSEILDTRFICLLAPIQKLLIQ